MTSIQRYNSILLHHLVCLRGLPGVMVTPTVSYTNFSPNPSESLIPRANNNNNNNNLIDWYSIWISFYLHMSSRAVLLGLDGIFGYKNPAIVQFISSLCVQKSKYIVLATVA